MSTHFEQIPPVVIDFIRGVFSSANDKVTRTMCVQPSMHEETLDHTLIMELAASPPAYFSREEMAVTLQSHWLGGRWMYERWEIADIAFFVLLRRQGNLVARKVALLQTKRLYSREIPVEHIDEAEYRIGIGRIVDIIDPIVPFSTQRQFSFDKGCKFSAMSAGDAQISRIDAYIAQRHIPVYYGLYNPINIPFSASFPSTNGSQAHGANELGMRILTSMSVHSALTSLTSGSSPSLQDLQIAQQDANDPYSIYGWRLETFIADEVLGCREGRLFENINDENLAYLLYRRSAPIAAAIAITIDIGSG